MTKFKMHPYRAPALNKYDFNGVGLNCKDYLFKVKLYNSTLIFWMVLGNLSAWSLKLANCARRRKAI